jgi:DNA-directed RNA polymerase specialized sigma24 family protein
VRALTDEAEAVGEAAASAEDVAALWEAYGPRIFAFCHRVLGHTGLAADATQDAFLLAHEELGRLGGSEEAFAGAVFRAAHTTSFDLLPRAAHPEPRAQRSLSAAAGRLRPQQRAALALAGLEGLSHAGIASALGIEKAAVPALLGRARLRLYDELHGTAVAAAAVRAPDCEDMLPVLAAGVDGELEGTEATWADPHVERCATCPRTIRAMTQAAGTYAAWSPAAAPSWLRAATLADADDVPAPAAEAAPVRRGRGRAAAATRSALGATLATAASATLLVGAARSLHEDEEALGGARLAVASPSVAMATVSALSSARHGGRGRQGAGGRALRARRTVSVTVPASGSPTPVSGSPTPAPASPTPARRPATATPTPVAPAAGGALTAPGAPATQDAPQATTDAPTTTAVAASASAPSAPPPAAAIAAAPLPAASAAPVPVAPDGADGDAACDGHDGRRG